MSRFQWPSIGNDGKVVALPKAKEKLKPPTAQEIEAVYEQARREGHAQGMAEAAEAAAQASAAQMAAMQQEFVDSLSHALTQLQETVDQEDQHLARSIEWLCRETVEQALLNVLSEPESMPSLVKALIDRIPGRANEVTVHLHPDTAHLVDGAIADPALAPFGIRIETADALVEHDPLGAVQSPS